MLDARWHSIREALLRGGVAPRPAARLCSEWCAHHSDLIQSALAAGADARAADRSAWVALGEPAQLIAAALARPELRSTARRHPALAFGLTPLVVFALAFVSALALLVFMAEFTEIELLGRPMDVSAILHAVFAWLLPIGVAIATVSWAVRHRAFCCWPVVGVLLVAGLGAATNVDLVRDAAMLPVALQAGAGISADTLGPFLLRVATTLGCAGLIYLWQRSRLSRAV
jgi:nitrate reductase NapE component